MYTLGLNKIKSNDISPTESLKIEHGNSMISTLPVIKEVGQYFFDHIRNLFQNQFTITSN